MAAAAAATFNTNTNTNTDGKSSLAHGFEDAANNQLIPGENGGALVANIDPLVAALNDLVRGITDDRIRELVRNMVARVKELSANNKEEALEYLQNIFKLIFHKRCIHYHNPVEGQEESKKANISGEGEKRIFFRLIIELYAYYPAIINAIILTNIIPQYGCYKDYFQIWEMISKMGEEEQPKYNNLIQAICSVILAEIQDIVDNKKEPTLLFKWLPSEKSRFDKNCKLKFRMQEKSHSDKYCKLTDHNSVSVLAYFLFYQDVSNPITRKKMYRKLVSDMRQKLDFPEIKMCAKQFSHIDYKRISSRAWTIYSKAFLNINKSGGERSQEDDRRKGRENVVEFIDENAHRITGATLQPHELIYNMVSTSDEHETEILIAQYWNLRFENAIQILVYVISLDKLGIPVSNMIPKILPMSDVSRSMLGKPIEVAISLGIYFTDFSHYLIDVMKNFVELIEAYIETGGYEYKENIAYKSSANYRKLVDDFIDDYTNNSLPVDFAKYTNRFYEIKALDKSKYLNNIMMSFTDTPKIIVFGDDMSLKDKYNEIMKHTGYSTNFEAAFDTYLRICVENRISDNELQSILCITDGQMNEFDRSSVWKTCYDNIIQKWRIKYGYKNPPPMIFWNVRANTDGYQADADKEGVQLLAGFSPSVIKGVLYGQFADTVLKTVLMDDGTVEEVEVSAITPWDTLMGLLSADQYTQISDIVRRVVEESLLLE